MFSSHFRRALAFSFCATWLAVAAHAQPYGDWRSDAPGKLHRITPADMPAPYATRSAADGPRMIEPPAGALPQVPAGFSVQRFASGLRMPRVVRVAPNGDIFVAESAAGRIRVFRAADGAAQPQRNEVFATGLDSPFGIAFYPPGPDPQFVYVAETNAVVRYPYRGGDLHARAGRETIVPQISPTADFHWTRDIAFSADGARMFVSVGSGSNDAEDLPRLSAEAIRRHDAEFGARLRLGSGATARRRAVLLARRQGPACVRHRLAQLLRPGEVAAAGDLWCAVNERDGLGDNLPPDFATRVQQGQFFGWPWYYIGSHADPEHADQRPDLAGHVTVPEVLIQPHSAPLASPSTKAPASPRSRRSTAAMPSSHCTDHGTERRRTGYKVVRIHLHNGVPDGSYQDFLTGFVTGNGSVWGRPVDVAVAHDGALLVTEDGNGTIWRIAFGAGHYHVAIS